MMKSNGAIIDPYGTPILMGNILFPSIDPLYDDKSNFIISMVFYLNGSFSILFIIN